MDIKERLSRRKFLKAASALGVSVTLPACSSSSSDDNWQGSTTSELVYPEVTEHWCSGQHSCGMICGHKMHVNKYGRMVAMTSGGDLHRSDPDAAEKDESVAMPQRRACVKGYSYIKRYYQPDRLKYPLMRVEGKERGDLSGFKRVSWDEAIKKIAGIFKDAQKRAQDGLGYLPVKAFWKVPEIMAKNTTTGKYPLGYPGLAIYGNASFGNIAASLWDGISYNAAYNSLIDVFNTKLLVVWGVDATTTNSSMGGPYWYYLKAKESGIPLVVIDVKYSDTAATMGTGLTYTGPMGAPGSTVNKSVKIPAWITIHPGTDCAMSAAMAYVIYSNGLYDADYLKKHCFGFFKNDKLEGYSVDLGSGPMQANSLAPDLLLTSDFSKLVDGLKVATGNYQSPIKANDYSLYHEGILPQIYTYNNYNAVPAGASFEEYLQSMEADHGSYEGVLNWAENITGVSAVTIEALARAFAKAKPARLEGGGGPQRVSNGMYYTWMNMALAAMCGYSSIKGGGPGFSMFNEAGGYTYGVAYFTGMYNKLSPFDQILVAIDKPADLVTKGKDGRTRQQIADDFMHFHGIDKSGIVGDLSKKMIEIDTFINCGNNLCTMPNSNKYIEAVTRKNANGEYTLKNVIHTEQFMSTTAMYSDLILPWRYALETESIAMQTQQDIYYQEQICKPAGEVKTDDEVWCMVYKEMGMDHDPIYEGEAVVEGTYKYLINFAEHIAKKYPEWVIPDFAEFKKAGKLDFPMDKNRPFVGLADISPIGKRSVNEADRVRGELSNTTGLINLWSPFYALMRPGRVKYPGPRYMQPVEGYESMLEKDHSGEYTMNPNGSYNFVGYKSPYSGNTYTLQLITDKPRHRSHTIMGNVAIINDNYPQNCMINPADAAARGINEGDMVYVYNDRGCTKIPAELTHRTPPGVIRIFHGAWYRPHPTEKVRVWLDTDLDSSGNDIVKEYVVSVDIGGCENILTLDYQNGPLDPYVGGSINVQGCLIEVSKTKPRE